MSEDKNMKKPIMANFVIAGGLICMGLGAAFIAPAVEEPIAAAAKNVFDHNPLFAHQPEELVYDAQGRVSEVPDHSKEDLIGAGLIVLGVAGLVMGANMRPRDPRRSSFPRSVC